MFYILTAKEVDNLSQPGTIKIVSKNETTYLKNAELNASWLLTKYITEVPCKADQAFLKLKGHQHFLSEFSAREYFNNYTSSKSK